jgi:hypothetical protein
LCSMIFSIRYGLIVDPLSWRHDVDTSHLRWLAFRIVAVGPAPLPASDVIQDSVSRERARRRFGLISACTKVQPRSRPFAAVGLCRALSDSSVLQV